MGPYGVLFALLATALSAAPHVDVTLALSLRGERVGAVHVRFDGQDYAYVSDTIVRRGSELTPERFEAHRKAGEALPSTLALWMFRDGDRERCLDVEDERDRKKGQVCATREGRTLAGTLLGEPFTALLDGDNGPTTLDLPRQQAHFERVDGPLPPPVPRDLFAGARQIDALKNLDSADRVRLRGSSSTCSIDAVLERVAPSKDEPLAPGAKLELDAGTRWRTAVALAKFVDQAVQPAAASPADEEPKQVLASHRGSCVGQARVFAMLAGARLPTRVVYGVLVEDGRAAAHAWDEVQVSGRWYGVDPSRGVAPIGPEHIPLAREGDPDPLRAGRCLLALPSMKWDVEAR